MITKLWRWTTVFYTRSHIIRRYNFTKSRYWDAAHPSTLDTQMRPLWWIALGCWRGNGTSCRCISQQLLQNCWIFFYPKSVYVYLYIFSYCQTHCLREKKKRSSLENLNKRLEVWISCRFLSGQTPPTALYLSFVQQRGKNRRMGATWKAGFGLEAALGWCPAATQWNGWDGTWAVQARLGEKNQRLQFQHLSETHFHVIGGFHP